MALNGLRKSCASRALNNSFKRSVSVRSCSASAVPCPAGRLASVRAYS
jgi:hypothetical protein